MLPNWKSIRKWVKEREKFLHASDLELLNHSLELKLSRWCLISLPHNLNLSVFITIWSSSSLQRSFSTRRKWTLLHVFNDKAFFNLREPSLANWTSILSLFFTLLKSTYLRPLLYTEVAKVVSTTLNFTLFHYHELTYRTITHSTLLPSLRSGLLQVFFCCHFHDIHVNFLFLLLLRVDRTLVGRMRQLCFFFKLFLVSSSIVILHLNLL